MPMVAANAHELRVMGAEGDTRISWDPNDTGSVADASKTFDDLVAKGYRAFSMASGGGRGEPMTTFNPAAEQVIVAAPIAGG